MATAARKEPVGRLKANERLGSKYSLVRRIAVGGMGEIWIALNEMTDAQVALKVLRGDIDTKVEVEPRFRHEARLGAMLSHRNIIRIFDLVEEADGSLVLVMELLRGETLRHYLKARGPIDASEAVALTLPILSALEHAHEMGVVHRDLKPANIYLAVDPDGHVTPKLLDFGIAKLPMAGVHTLDGRVLGTPRYMSPEQIRSEPNIDGRSDLFSVGVLLMEMMTGQSPFFAKTPSASLAAVLESQVDPDPRIDPRLWLVIQRALAKRPYERYGTANDFAKALREAIPVSDEDLAARLRRDKPPPRVTSSGPLRPGMGGMSTMGGLGGGPATRGPAGGEGVPRVGGPGASGRPPPDLAGFVDGDLDSEDDESASIGGAARVMERLSRGGFGAVGDGRRASETVAGNTGSLPIAGVPTARSRRQTIAVVGVTALVMAFIGAAVLSRRSPPGEADADGKTAGASAGLVASDVVGASSLSALGVPDVPAGGGATPPATGVAGGTGASMMELPASRPAHTPATRTRTRGGHSGGAKESGSGSTGAGGQDTKPAKPVATTPGF